MPSGRVHDGDEGPKESEDNLNEIRSVLRVSWMLVIVSILVFLLLLWTNRIGSSANFSFGMGRYNHGVSEHSSSPTPTELGAGMKAHPFHSQNLLPDTVGAFISVYRNPKAVFNVLKEYRDAYPEGDLVVICDEGCYNFSDLCTHFRAIWDGKPRRLTTKTDPGWYLRLPNIHAYMETLAYALPFIRSKYYLYLETDVAIKSRLRVVDLQYTLNGIVPVRTGWFIGAEPFFAASLNPTFDLQSWPVSPKGEPWHWIPYGGQGGTTFNTQFMRAIALQPYADRIADERMLSGCSTTIGVDYMHTALVYRYNGTVGPFSGYRLSHDAFKVEEYRADKTCQVFHADKTHYNQPLSEEELKIMGPHWETPIHAPPEEEQPVLKPYDTCSPMIDKPEENNYPHRPGDSGLATDERRRGGVWNIDDIRGTGYYFQNGID